MKKRYLQNAALAALALAAVILIAGRIIPRKLESLMPKGFQPESGHVGFLGWDDFDWGIDADLSEEGLQRLWTYLDALEYRYDGRVPGGVMKGEMYHLTFFQQEPPELVYVYVTKALGVVYLNDREYEMVGDTKPLLEFLDGLK